MSVSRYVPHPTSLLPSFAAPSTTPADQRSRRKPKIHPTSYLDGLRGLAAFSVFAYHYTDYNHKFFLPAWGSNPPEEGSSLLQLPYVRLLYAGTPMVHIFFVISGFALAYRPLRCLHERNAAGGTLPPPAVCVRDREKEKEVEKDAVSPTKGMGGSFYVTSPSQKAIAKCHNILASSALRRPIRLFGPPLALTLIDVVLVRLGFMSGFLRHHDTLWEQLTDWFTDAVTAVTWPWGWDDGPHSRYNPHLWTIPIEFSHSMLLFLLLIVVSRLRTSGLRRIVMTLVMCYSLLFCARWAAFEFVSGALLADFHLENDAREKEKDKTESKLILGCAGVLNVLCPTFLLAFAGFIVSWPSRPDDITPTFAYLRSTAPPAYTHEDREHGRDFWYALAALSFVWSAGKLRSLQNLLEGRVPQYLGKISFALYILQHPILNTCEHHVLGAPYHAATEEDPERPGWGVRGLTGESTPLQRTICWFTGLAVLGSILIWLADLFTRAIDAPCVKLARTLETFVFLQEDRGGEHTLPAKW
ncbi:putative hard surface induced protein [Zalerion maritima]|uniref:Hard surface induced protein n=1 Tax=Zalerion maritima TaxID=339359 RepID=A0AAD5RWV8_9PEZI|nr:putative hard surface induced protein [Zalerion maritima]